MNLIQETHVKKYSKRQTYSHVSFAYKISCLAPREMWSGEDLAVLLMAARMDLENTGQDYLAKIVKGMKKPEA